MGPKAAGQPGAARRRPEQVLARRGGGVELLRIPAALFGLIVDLRGALYERGWLPAERVEVPVISIGNLSAGGTGKTPFTIWLAEELLSRGRRPGVVSRGYRSGEGENDESRMLAGRLPSVERIENPERAAGARDLIARGADVILLDDGFQHRRLRRDLDLVLIDATRPWGLPSESEGRAPVRALLPRGLLREKPPALARADALVITRSDQVPAETLAELEASLIEQAPGPAILHAVHRPRRLRDVDGGSHELEELDGREVDLASGIGNPDAFGPRSGPSGRVCASTAASPTTTTTPTRTSRGSARTGAGS